MKTIFHFLVPALLLTGFLVNCKGSDEMHGQEAPAPAPPSEVIGGIELGIDVSAQDPSVLGLTSTFEFLSATVLLTCDDFAGNAIGNGPQEVSLTKPLVIYGNPTGCLMQLKKLRSATGEFVPKPNQDFKTYAIGDKGIFTDGTVDITLSVLVQLPKRIAANSRVIYQFSTVTRDNDVTIGDELDITNHHILVVGQKPPSLALIKTQLLAITPTSASFFFRYDCEVKIRGTSPADADCDGFRPNALELHHSIVANPTNQTLEGLTSAFDQSKKSFFTLPHLTFSAPSPTRLNGGFDFRLSLADIGDKDITNLSGKTLLMALRASGQTSVRYSFVKIPHFAPAGIKPQSPYRLIARHSNKCASVENNSLNVHAAIKQVTCDNRAGQSFEVQKVATGGYSLVNAGSKKCVTVFPSDSNDGSKLVQKDCAGTPNQILDFIPAHSGSFLVRFRHSNKCMDVEGIDPAEGQSIHQWSCLGTASANQNWYFQPF